VAPVLYVFGALFLVDAIRSVIASAPLFEHLVFLAEMLVASAGTLWVLRARRPEGLVVPEVDAMEGTALRLFGRLLLAAFASASSSAASATRGWAASSAPALSVARTSAWRSSPRSRSRRG
jgi:hypothetical protein